MMTGVRRELPAILLLLSLQTWAESVDNEQPIHVEADRLTVSQESGTSVYRGNVVVNQGSLRLSAEEVSIFSEADEITRIVASVPDTATKLAVYEQQEQLVQGQARRIIYHVSEDRLEFVGDAALRRGNDTRVSGDRVNYDAAAGRVNASSEQSGRVKTTITPAGSSN